VIGEILKLYVILYKHSDNSKVFNKIYKFDKEDIIAKGYNLEKWIWSIGYYEKMGRHDCRIHAVAFDEFNFKVLFDIDYIFKCVGSEVEGR
jgi:hypothetical protein